MSPSGNDRSARRCPICGRATAAAFKPFCSKRCARIDLGRWLGGRYAIPAADQQPPEKEPDAENEDM